MSTGIDSTATFVDDLSELLQRGTVGLIGDARLAGPAAPQDSAAELVPDLASGCVGIGLVYGDDIVLAITLTNGFASEFAGETTPTALQHALSDTIAELAGARHEQLAQVVGLENEHDLVEFLSDRPGLVGAGVFDGDNVVATLGAAGPALATAPTQVPTQAPATTPDPIIPDIAFAEPGAPAIEPTVSDVVPESSTRPEVDDHRLARGLALLADVNLEVTAELGRTRLRVSELLSLEPGSVIGLEREAGSPVDLLVNGTLFARAEVIVVDNQYAVRITELVGGGVPA
ncbi:MAG TPA: flagellar motor switch protein FliN [Microthrixaceae bacterium]|nr:flagellar motor switch protein FliN [Microthrixaceae bacterium]